MRSNTFEKKNCQWSLMKSLQRAQGNTDHSSEEFMDDERNPKRTGRKQGGEDQDNEDLGNYRAIN